MKKHMYLLTMLFCLGNLQAGGQNMNALCTAIVRYDIQGVEQALEENKGDTDYVHSGIAGSTPLMMVAYRSYENDKAAEIIQILLKNGADMRCTIHGVTPLHAIVLGLASNFESGDYNVLVKRCKRAIDLLFQSFNDDINAIDALSLAENKTGQIALEIAFEHGLSSIVDRLLCYTSENAHQQIDIAKLQAQNARKQESFAACATILDEMSGITW